MPARKKTPATPAVESSNDHPEAPPEDVPEIEDPEEDDEESEGEGETLGDEDTEEDEDELYDPMQALYNEEGESIAQVLTNIEQTLQKHLVVQNTLLRKLQKHFCDN